MGPWLHRVAGSVIVAIGIAVPTAAPALAHHGFTGEYDAASPIYVAGTVTAATYGYPHALIRVRPAAPTTPPADLANLTDREQQNLGGLEVVTSALPLRATGGGELTLLLPPPMTTEVGNRSDRPEAGDDVGAVVFRECSTGELRVQLLRISASQRVVRSGVMQTEVRGCPGAPPPSASAADTAATPATRGDVPQVPSEVVVATDSPVSTARVAVVAGAAALGAVVVASVLIVAARRGGGAS